MCLVTKAFFAGEISIMVISHVNHFHCRSPGPQIWLLTELYHFSPAVTNQIKIYASPTKSCCNASLQARELVFMPIKYGYTFLANK